jgi:hypothetical protein
VGILEGLSDNDGVVEGFDDIDGIDDDEGSFEGNFDGLVVGAWVIIGARFSQFIAFNAHQPQILQHDPS